MNTVTIYNDSDGVQKPFINFLFFLANKHGFFIDNSIDGLKKFRSLVENEFNAQICFNDKTVELHFDKESDKTLFLMQFN